MINNKVINFMIPEQADREAYIKICEKRQIEFSDHLSKMEIPAELKAWEKEFVDTRTATVIGMFSMQKGNADLTPEDLTELNQLKKEAALVTIGANCVRPIIALLIGMWGEAVEHWPDEFDDALIKRAFKWTIEGKLFEGITYANKVMAGE